VLRIARASLIFAVGAVSAVAACSGGGTKDANAPKPDPSAAATPSAKAGEPVDAGAEAGSDRPFAGSAAEATQLITDAVDKKQSEIAKCVQQYRFRTHLAHEKVSVNMGIDQEGRLIGVTLPKNKEDKELTACVQKELKDSKFPRSHAGVITITRTFQEMVQ
jgi:hypothetical protein